MICALCLGSAPLSAQEVGSALDCAAFWEGYARFADVSAYLDGAAEAREAAAGFRTEALETAPAAEVDAFIAREAPGRALMVEAFTLGDETSQRLTVQSLERCEAPRD